MRCRRFPSMHAEGASLHVASIAIKLNLLVVTNLRLIRGQTELYLIPLHQSVNCKHDHIPFDLTRKGIVFLSRRKNRVIISLRNLISRDKSSASNITRFY